MKSALLFLVLLAVLQSHTLTRIGGGELAGAFTATGLTYEDDTHKWVVVDSIRVANAAPNP